jgi:hypothetical protein
MKEDLENASNGEITKTFEGRATYENRELEDFIEGEYISIRDGGSRVIEFVKGKEKLVDKTDFNGRPTKKVQFIVIDPDDPEQKEKKFELSRKHVAKIYNELKKGYSVLEIYRSGTGKETQYIPKGIK